jgi:hypothetical protein
MSARLNSASVRANLRASYEGASLRCTFPMAVPLAPARRAGPISVGSAANQRLEPFRARARPNIRGRFPQNRSAARAGNRSTRGPGPLYATGLVRALIYETYVGSRQSGSFRSFAGHAKRTTSGLNRVNESVARGVAADVVVGTAVGVLSTAIPVVGAAVAGYQTAGMIYTAYSAGDKAYARTGDRDAAITAAARSMAKSVASAAMDQAIGAAVSAGWSATKQAAGLATSKKADLVIETAGSATLEALAGQWKRKKRK